jgi:hypothetical protein
MLDWNVVISGQGRAGTITYSEGANSIRFAWELGGRDVIAIISGPSPQNWDSDLAWTIGRRQEILDRVAREAIRLKAPTANAEFTDGDTTILLRRHLRK